MATFSDYLKNIFWVLLLIQFAPFLIKGIRSQYSDLFEEKTRVGVITIKGMIRSAYPAVKDIKKIFEDKSIKAVVLRVDSPGGGSAAAQSIFHELLHYKKQHPEKYVVTLVEQVAASGGYYVACAADYIISTPSALVGSIGVYIAHPNFKEFIEQFQIKYSITKTGTYKGAGDPLLTLTPEQKAQFQDLSNNTYQQFVKDVAKQRPQLPHDSTKWAEGKIFTGEQAVGLNLVDETGSPATVEKVLRDKAQIVGRIEWIKPTKKRPFLASIIKPEEDDEDTTFLASVVNSICTTLEARYSSHTKLQ